MMNIGPNWMWGYDATRLNRIFEILMTLPGACGATA
jgi:hypothetical protein